MKQLLGLTFPLWLLIASIPLYVGLAQEMDYAMYDYDDNENSTVTTTGPTEPILTNEAIANIVVSGTVIIFLILTISILFCLFEKSEHKLRVKTALERNKQIDRQMAAEKRMKEIRSEKFRQKQAAEAATNVLQVRTTVTESGDVKYEEASPQSTQVNMEAELTDAEREATELLQDNTSPSTSEIVVDLESTDDSPTETKRQLVKLDSYTPFSAAAHDQQHPAVLLVQPVKDS